MRKEKKQNKKNETRDDSEEATLYGDGHAHALDDLETVKDLNTSKEVCGVTKRTSRESKSPNACPRLDSCASYKTIRRLPQPL